VLKIAARRAAKFFVKLGGAEKAMNVKVLKVAAHRAAKNF